MMNSDAQDRERDRKPAGMAASFDRSAAPEAVISAILNLFI
jgi:hypothetical protein